MSAGTSLTSAVIDRRYSWKVGYFIRHNQYIRGDALHESSLSVMFALQNKYRWAQWASLPLRLVIGYGFMVHGWAKWSRGPAAFAKLLQQIGVPLPEFTAWTVTLLELFGGLAIFLGAFVALVSIPLILSMLVAMFTVHLKYGFSAIKTIGLTKDGPVFGPPGYEVSLLYVAGLLVLLLSGPGPLSVEHWLARRRKTNGIRQTNSV